MMILLLGSVGCREEYVFPSGPDSSSTSLDLWPHGDGSSWSNVMEAGFLSEEDLAETAVASSRTSPAAGCDEDGDLSTLHFVSSESVMPLVGFKETNGFWRMLQADAYSRTNLHVSLRDRVRTEAPLAEPGIILDVIDHARIHSPGVEESSGVLGGRTGDLPLDRYWVLF